MYGAGRALVVGSGPAGLSAAWYLSLSGYEVTVFEELDHPGGVLYWGIPSFRLDRSVLDANLKRLEEVGVNFETGRKVVPDELSSLSEVYHLVVIATGLTKPRKLPIDGIENAIMGIDFLKKYNLGNISSFPKKAVVIGGGNVAIDVARVLAREGTEVKVVCVEPYEEMPAIREEVSQAQAEGVKIVPSTGVKRIEKANGTFVLELAPVEIIGESQRIKQVVYKGGPYQENCGMVIAAFGQEPEFFDWSGEIAGDLVLGPSTVVQAIASGRDTVYRLLRYNGGIVEPSRERLEVVNFESLNTDYFSHEPASVDISTVDDALREMSRCFSCGYCNQCGNCYIFCPDVAVLWTDAFPEVDTDHCKGCGICTEECPRNIILMKRKY